MRQQIYVGMLGATLYAMTAQAQPSMADELRQWIDRAEAQRGNHRLHGYREGSLVALFSYDTSQPKSPIVLRIRGQDEPIRLYGPTLFPEPLGQSQVVETLLRGILLLPDEKSPASPPGSSATLAERLN